MKYFQISNFFNHKTKFYFQYILIILLKLNCLNNALNNINKFEVILGKK